MAAIDYSLLIDWIGTSSAWYNDAEACWIPRGAVSASAALVDLTGNGNDLTYTNYAEAGWSAENGWAGSADGYFDTGIVPQLEQTIYVAFTDTEDTGSNADLIGTRELIGAAQRQHYLRNRGGLTGLQYNFMDNVQADGTYRTDGVVAMNKNGFWLNGVERWAQTISTSYTFTINMFLMALNNNGTENNILTTGHVAAVCIVNATDDDDTIKLRSHAMRNIINQNTAFPTVPIASFEDRLIWWSAKRGNDYYISPTGRGFEPKAIGRATFVLDNNDNELDPRNSASSLYGYLEPGKLIHLKYDVGHGTAGLFAGVIDDIIVDRRSKRVTLQCVDMWDWLNQKIPSVAIQENITADTAIGAILDSVQYPNIFGRSLGTGIDNIPYWWAAGNTAKREIENLVDADIGIAYVDGNGKFTYLNRRNKSAGISTPTALTESEFNKDIKITEPWENIRNTIDIRVTTRQEVSATTIWEYAEQKRLAPGEQFEIWASFRYDGEFVPALEVQAPTIVFNARESGLGDDILSDLIVTTTTYADRMKIVVKNDGSVTGWLLSASITGNPVSTLGISRIIENARGYDTKPKPLYIDNDWLQDYNTAKGFAQFLIDYLNSGAPFITVSRNARPSATDPFMYTILYTRYNINFTTMNVSAYYWNTSIEYTCGQNVNDVLVKIRFMPAYDDATKVFFKLDVSELDSTDVLAW